MQSEVKNPKPYNFLPDCDSVFNHFLIRGAEIKRKSPEKRGSPKLRLVGIF
jgi:hypothetical protein